MHADHAFLLPFVTRFEESPSDKWLRTALMRGEATSIQANVGCASHLDAVRRINRAYVATPQVLPLARAILRLARESAIARYLDPHLYVDICMSPHDDALFDALIPSDSVPVWMTHALPGRGKTCLFSRLQYVLPASTEAAVEGNPPQRITVRPALWIRLGEHFSLRDWMGDALSEFGIDQKTIKQNRSVAQRTKLLRKTLYRHGIVLLLLDELQFFAGKDATTKVMNMLLALRQLGVPIVGFANTDLLINMRAARAQMNQRIPTREILLDPIARNDPVWAEILKAQFAACPGGHTVPVDREAGNLWDLLFGSPRGSAALISIALDTAMAERRPLTLRDVHAAWRSASFEPFRREAGILRRPGPVDVRTHPELTSINSNERKRSDFEKERDAQVLEANAYVALQMQLTPSEAAADRTFKVRTLREAGKLAENVVSLGEGKRKRGKPRPALEELIGGSMFSKAVDPSAESPFGPRENGTGDDES